jgi:hypothetical protein
MIAEGLLDNERDLMKQAAAVPGEQNMGWWKRGRYFSTMYFKLLELRIDRQRAQAFVTAVQQLSKIPR